MSYIPPAGPATPTNLGTVKLTGDLGGTGNAPTVPALNTKATSVVYSTGTGWPTRPSGAAGAVTWIDPTGSAVAPTGALIGDIFINAAEDAAIGGVQLLTAAEMTFKADWVVSTGSPIINTTAGTVTLTSQNDLVNLVPVGSSPQGLYSVKAGKQYEIQVTPVAGQTGAIIIHANFISTSTAVVYGWVNAQLASVGSGTSPVTFVTTVAPSDVQRLDVMISGDASNTASVTLKAVSVKEVG